MANSESFYTPINWNYLGGGKRYTQTHMCTHSFVWENYSWAIPLQTRWLNDHIFKPVRWCLASPAQAAVVKDRTSHKQQLKQVQDELPDGKDAIILRKTVTMVSAKIFQVAPKLSHPDNVTAGSLAMVAFGFQHGWAGSPVLNSSCSAILQEGWRGPAAARLGPPSQNKSKHVAEPLKLPTCCSWMQSHCF